MKQQSLFIFGATMIICALAVAVACAVLGMVRDGKWVEAGITSSLCFGAVLMAVALIRE